MPLLRYYNPSNPRQQYQTMSSTDPNIPAGWLDTQGSDGATPEALKQYTPGVNSGGYPAYGDQVTNFPWINGILGGYGGGKAKG